MVFHPQAQNTTLHHLQTQVIFQHSGLAIWSFCQQPGGKSLFGDSSKLAFESKGETRARDKETHKMGG